MSLLSSWRERQSGSLRVIGSEQNNQNSNTSEDAWTPSGKSGATLSSMNLASVASLPDTRRMVVETTLTKLLNDRHFSICALDKVLEIVGGRQSGEAYKLLGALHCVDYTAMPPELRERIPALVNECLRQQTKTVEIVDSMLNGVEI